MTAESNVTDRHAGAMALVRRLRALLDDEFEALKAQDLEWFERMQPTKLELLQSLAGAVPPESTATAAGDSANAAQLALQMQQWDEFVAVMNECREAHRRNDVLIRSKLEAIRGTLRMLQSADESSSVDIYDRLGRVGGGPRGRGYQDA
jgi:flagellar biosynthesis/type III secretory pathway chaperone